MSGGILERLSDLQSQTKRDYEDLSVIQLEKKRLMIKKADLEDEVEEQEVKPISDLNGQKIYNRVLPLVREIHKLEVKKQQLHHELHLLQVREDVRDVFTILTAPASDRRGALYAWYTQLEKLAGGDDAGDDGCCCQHVRYSPRVEADQLVEQLCFTVLHSGLTVQVTISAAARLPHHSDAGQCDPKISVCSSLHMEGLSDMVTSLLEEDHPVDGLLNFVTESLTKDVLPYIRRDGL
ncbi:uncharacterized protein LOC124285388 [Haliotis rubra]|uniref:uncharacterized protein LOC124285388 n=1 Tax=Haliotis rubra TaxID=36100 RepID=UPI001EE58695|nr:uncharacterized protein LOC124285388 [Haliotis rubra]